MLAYMLLSQLELFRYPFLTTTPTPRGWSQTNFVGLWLVSRPRFGRHGDRDMGDVSTYGQIIPSLLGSLKPPGLNPSLCADTW